MEYHSALKRKGSLARAPWMNLEDILRSEISQSHKYEDDMIPLRRVLRVVTFVETESQMAVASGSGEGAMGS